MKGLPDSFGPATRAWLEARFDAPTPVQERGWPILAARQHALLVAPTGSGKTLAAFLESIDRLGRLPEEAEAGVRVLYVSPLKALVHDIERNLRQPLEGIGAAAIGDGVVFRPPRVAIRTGDSTPKARRQQASNPAEILVTTPESLYLILGSRQRETLRSVETVIIDEIHSLAPTKRGVHLALSLERLARLCRSGDPQRIGLSATARPIAEIARFLGGDRKVETVDASRPPDIVLSISVPVPDMTHPGAGSRNGFARGDPEGNPAAGPAEATPLWSVIHPELLERIRASRSSILFVNSRGLCERLADRLNELAGEPLVRAHHGSLAHDKRREIEGALARGELRAIVATSSLELGIDMQAVEQVLLVESPGAVARGLQRIGRAGHAVGATSVGVLFPKHRADLLESTVVARGMREGAVEAVRVPENALDVLAQQLVALAAEGPIRLDEIETILGRTASYAKLGRPLLRSVLDMLAGRYPSTEFAELRPRLVWDRENDRIEAREGAGRIALLSGGTIPDRGQYAVHLGAEGPRIGELDEELVHESKPGDVVTLGASSWRILGITRDRVVVTPAPGEPGRLPFWHGDGPGRSLELGCAIGRFVRELREVDDPEDELVRHSGLDQHAARNLVAYLEDQRAATGSCPSDEGILIERFRDELGDWRICLLSPFGSRIHAPWALAISARLARCGDADPQTTWTDDGILFRFADADRLPSTDLFLPSPDEVEELVIDRLGASSLFAARFRENAARALLLPRWRPGARMPLWLQRLRAQNLHAVARRFPDFPIMLETYRDCMQDVFDMPGLVGILAGIRSRGISVEDVETPSPSPFARSLVFAYTAEHLYQQDLPTAERRTRALGLDKAMLRELLGTDAHRDLLDARVIEQVEAQLQGRGDGRKARHADALHDLLRRVGDLTPEELLERYEGDAGSLGRECAMLGRTGRVVSIDIAGRAAFVAVEDAAFYRDGLGVGLPEGMPDAFLERTKAPLEELLIRFARTHGPFTTKTAADRFGLRPSQVEPVLAALAREERLREGEFDPRGSEREWCEPTVLRRIKRGTLERLRKEISPVPRDVSCRFQIEWHGIGCGRSGAARFGEVIDLLEGLPLSFVELERSILPARIADYQPQMLDERGASGELVWVGCRSLGDKDGRIAIYRRDHIASLLEPAPVPPDLGPVSRILLEYLQDKGASFHADLVQSVPVRSQGAILDALWELVWQGLVTNDTFAPIRALAFRPPSHRRRGRRGPPSTTAGRWSLVSNLLIGSPPRTKRLHERTGLYLARHGIVSREALAIESEAGGFASIYPVLREMEGAGRVRRGHFALGMTSAQFAIPGAVDRLRSLRTSTDAENAVLLAATDPAQLHGTLFEWPATRRNRGRPRRAVGAAVVLVDGSPCLFIDGGGQRVSTFVADPDAETKDSGEPGSRLERGVRALVRDMGRLGPGGLRIEEIDGEPARSSSLAPVFLRAGFHEGYRSLEIERLRTDPGKVMDGP